MKVLDLCCQNDHTFEGWFGSEADLPRPAPAWTVAMPFVRSLPGAQGAECTAYPAGCPCSVPRRACTIRVLVTLPASAPGGADHSVASLQAASLEVARKLSPRPKTLGERFADEARRMHHGEVPPSALSAAKPAAKKLCSCSMKALPFYPCPASPPKPCIDRLAAPLAVARNSFSFDSFSRPRGGPWCCF